MQNSDRCAILFFIDVNVIIISFHYDFSVMIVVQKSD